MAVVPLEYLQKYNSPKNPLPNPVIKGSVSSGPGSYYYSPQTNQVLPVQQNLLTQAPVTNQNPGPGITNQAPAGPTQAEIDAYNALYQPAINYYNQAETNYRNQLPIDQGNINAQYDLYGNRLTQSQNSALTNIGLDETQLSQAVENNQNKIRQAYNEIGQGIQSRFGTASSTGPAVFEILGRETASQMGANEQTGVQGLATLKAKKADLMQQATLAQQELDLKRAAALDDVKKQFDSAILEITRSRATTEQAKAQLNIQALTEARQRAYDVEDTYKQFKANLASTIASQDNFISAQEAQILAQMAEAGNITSNQIGQLYGGKGLPTTNAYQQAKTAASDLQGYYNLTEEEKRKRGLIL